MSEIKLEVARADPAAPISPSLERLLHPALFKKQPIFVAPLKAPEPGEKVYALSKEEVDSIRSMRGAAVDLHPGMGGVVPDRLIGMIQQGVKLTSLDFMLTQGCNFKCTWCFANSGPTKTDYLPFRTLERLTQEAAEIGTSFFVLTGGEPLVYHDPELGRQNRTGDNFFEVVRMIKRTCGERGISPKILTFDDVALITPEIAENFAENEVGLCTKGDTLIPELQDFKVGQRGAFERMQKGYAHLKEKGYGRDPKLRLVVNSVLDQTTFDGMIDVHMWALSNGFDHSIVPVHYCGSAAEEEQEAGVHSPHVKALYDLIARIDEKRFGITWKPWSAFSFNKTCNRNRSGLHVRANGDVTACSESPGRNETGRYTFGNVLAPGFSLKQLVQSERLAEYRREFAEGQGVFVCSPKVCDLYAHDLCQGGCAVRSAYSRIDYNTGLISKNEDPENYSRRREDPLCPAWTVLAQKQGILREGLLEEIHRRLLERTTAVDPADFPFISDEPQTGSAI